jgi:hypothetical protein
MEPHSQVITQRAPQALRGEALRCALDELGTSAVVSVHETPDEPVPLEPRDAFEVDLVGPPPSTAPPRALTGDELQRVLDALRQ